jgi:hypothetical protein
MAMSLVNSRVSGKKIVITLLVNIPHIDTFAACQYYRQRMIVMSAVVLFVF